jgi:hypothetical protein
VCCAVCLGPCHIHRCRELKWVSANATLRRRAKIWLTDTASMLRIWTRGVPFFPFCNYKVRRIYLGLDGFLSGSSNCKGHLKFRAVMEMLRKIKHILVPVTKLAIIHKNARHAVLFCGVSETVGHLICTHFCKWFKKVIDQKTRRIYIYKPPFFLVREKWLTRKKSEFTEPLS